MKRTRPCPWEDLVTVSSQHICYLHFLLCLSWWAAPTSVEKVSMLPASWFSPFSLERVYIHEASCCLLCGMGPPPSSSELIHILDECRHVKMACCLFSPSLWTAFLFFVLFSLFSSRLIFEMLVLVHC